MKVTTIEDIENKILQNSQKTEKIEKEFNSYLKSRNLKKGRVRPKDPIEAKILSSFTKR